MSENPPPTPLLIGTHHKAGTDETLLQDQDLAVFSTIFRFLGWPPSALPALTAIARANSLFGGVRAGAGHIRDGRGGQWREHFRPIHRQRFSQLFGDVLVRLGYEPFATEDAEGQ